MWKKYTLENGIVLSYHDDKHMYYVNDKKVESVTGICQRGVPKPQLINWLVNTPMNEVKRLIKSDGIKVNDKLYKNNDLSLREFSALKEIKISVGKKKIGILKII